MKSNLSSHEFHCTACFACIHSCPANAISSYVDDNGFYQIRIDEDVCIDCGRCLASCQQLEESAHLKVPEHCYAFVSSDDDVLNYSTSGGAFYEIALAFLENNPGGVVYGCCMHDDKSVDHIRCSSKDELRLIQGSKYVQSDMSACWTMMDADLKEGRKVLFSGTPCEVYSVRKEFGCSNLYLIDVVCHGVVGHRFFKDYLGWEEAKANSPVKSVTFRDKKKGWRCVGRIDFENGKSKKLDISTSYYYYYYYFSNSLFRESCYECRFATDKRCGDVTLGDFWGIDNIDRNVESKHGCSLILENTEKGKNLISHFSGMLHEECIELAKKYNHQLLEPSRCNRTEREEAYNAYESNGASGMAEVYSPSFSLKMKERAKDVIPSKLKSVIRRFGR